LIPAGTGLTFHNERRKRREKDKERYQLKTELSSLDS